MKKIIILAVMVGLLFSCEDKSEELTSNDSFDRGVMLANWADNIIVPAYQNYQSKTTTLHTAAQKFSLEPTQDNLLSFRSAWLEAYKAYQYVGMFEFGKAEELLLKDYTNIYPTDTKAIQDNIISGVYDLKLLSKNDQQGFPALDYLLFGLAENDAAILSFYTTSPQAANYKKYTTDVTSRLKNLIDQVVADWKNSYRDTYVSNTANSVNSSTNITVNAYIKYFEREIRSAKIGIPAGVGTNTILLGHTEAVYSKKYSKELCVVANQAMTDFYLGKHFLTTQKGMSLNAYLNSINGTELSSIIERKLVSIKTKASILNENISQQIQTDNIKVLAVYDEMQSLILNLKVDMTSLLGIAVNYVDSDGD